MKKMMFPILIVISLLMTGCSSQSRNQTDESSQAVAVLVGNHANSRSLNFNSNLVKETVGTTISTYGFLSIVSIDGNPDLVRAENYAIQDSVKQGNPTLLKKIADQTTSTVLSELFSIRANDPEVDLLESLRLAVRSLSAADTSLQKKILVIDTGLSTEGILDFNQNIINADPKVLAEELSERGEIPDFEGITVIWQQLGDVAEPQQKLSAKQTKALEEIWRTIIEKTGGTFELSTEVPNQGSIEGELPAVTPITFSVESPLSFSEGENSYLEGVAFTEERIRFIEDSAQFVSLNDATVSLKQVAEDLRLDKDLYILLIGTTAGDKTTEFAQQLSQRRAESVRKALIELGVEGNRMTAIGLGSDDPWHVYGVGTEGELATQNRKVVVISQDSPIAKRILAKVRRGNI